MCQVLLDFYRIKIVSQDYLQENLISITISAKDGDAKALYIAYVNLLDENK